MVTIKKLNVESIESIINFDKLCFPKDYWKEEDWKDLLEDEKAIYYALLDGNKIVGDIFIYNWKGERDYIKIMNIAIHSDYRKQGLAYKLLNYVTEEMKKLEMKRFCGETRASNKIMQKVFEDCGYKINVIEDDYYDNPNESAYKYVLQL
ncbi:MAG: GNAT family N-acetyltransferase [Clostridium sp.]|uniref:GNAT family N-acetyltransferase n=1 Tax=Clostridium sp. TaxID=1506 RepID=UPI00302428EE